MKSINKIILSCCLLFISVGYISAQDQIVLKDGKKISCEIKEVSDSVIKYVEIEDANQVVFTINRGQIREIKFSYGKVIEEAPEATNDAYYYDDKKRNIKVNFISIAADALVLTYEQAINPYSSWEVSTKLIGIGFNDEIDDQGFALTGGYKIKLKSITNKSGYRPDHLMHGSYLRFGAGVGFTNDDNAFTQRSMNVVHGGIDIGKQWILQNKIALDLYAGYHYTGGSFKTTSNGTTDDSFDTFFNHGDLAGEDNSAFSFGLRIGYLFSKNGEGKSSGKKR